MPLIHSMLFLSIIFVSILCLSLGAVSDLRVKLALTSPDRYETIVWEDKLTLEVDIEIIHGEFSAESGATLCVASENLYDIFPGLGSGVPVPILDNALTMNDLCTSSNRIILEGFLSGSHNIIVYLKAVEKGIVHIVAATDGVFQIILESQLHQPKSNTITLDEQYTLLDSITLFKKLQSPSADTTIVPFSKIIGIDHPISKANRWVHNYHSVESTCVNIVIFLKEIQHHGANNRLFHWLFDRVRFRDYGYCLSVVTGSNNASHSMELYEKLVNIAGVSVKQFDCLSINDNMTIDDVENSVVALSSYLYSDAVQVLLAVNTLGDQLSNYLLYAVDQPLTETDSRKNKPFVFIDLPNLLINSDWTLLYSAMDGVIAPSRYAGFSEGTASHGKHIAVIYPPACSVNWITQSPCYSHFIEFSTDSNATVKGVEETRRAKKHVVLSTYTTINSQPSKFEYSEAQKDSLLLGGAPKNRVKYIIANRLDSDKCPALLLLAIKYIRESLTAVELLEFDQLARFNFYGGGPLLRSLREMTVALGLEHMVTFRGAVVENELIAAMKQSDVLINPKIIGETFGFVHTEAAVMGLPVIAFRSGANSESVSSGVLIDPHSNSLTEDLAIALIAYYQKVSESDAGTDVSLCAAAKSRIAQWNIYRHSDSLMDAVNTVLSIT